MVATAMALMPDPGHVYASSAGCAAVPRAALIALQVTEQLPLLQEMRPALPLLLPPLLLLLSGTRARQLPT